MNKVLVTGAAGTLGRRVVWLLAARGWRPAAGIGRFVNVSSVSAIGLARHLAAVHGDPGVDRAGLWGWVDTRDAARAVAAALEVGFESIFDTDPARDLLGFVPIHGWRTI